MHLSSLVMTLVELYGWAIIIRVLLTWMPSLPDSLRPLARFLTQVTDPVLEPARRIIPPFGPLDFSPVVAFIVVTTVGRLLARLLAGIGL